MSAVICLISIAVLTAADQVIKFFAENNLSAESSIPVIKNILEWDYVQNTGAAFGIFENNTFLLSVITGIIILIGIIALIAKKIKGGFLQAVAVMIIAGGIGNLIDRIRLGYVTDYIKVLFIDFPVFNFADILVTCGSFMLIGYLIWDIVREQKNKNKGDKIG